MYLWFVCLLSLWPFYQFLFGILNEHFANSDLVFLFEMDKMSYYFECIRMRINVWIETFEIVRFKIKIIFCKIKNLK